ncbi:MAG: YkgJ family cysteine cluster protein [Kofleriaceae bacterium]|nr:YkgJ family cysteine cluster protein [Kofleriaceae bacterium]MBP9171548.1 YkgJ family cysteine cluster protein [Kofleriaceae bacterium]MBP9860195.1 YkgJ family cysteine cluster protein [Kofleriaceae bacterium]
MTRTIGARYVDPLAEVWLATAARLGLTVERRPDAYAATDGRGRLVIGSDDTLDVDDSLAQMIFHELCHWLVSGLASRAEPDWGLDNITTRDAWREHATLRLQRTIAGRYGLDRFFAPTTDYRVFWDALPADPLADRGDPSVVAAIRALALAERPPFAPALGDALAATAAIVAAAAPFAAPDSLARGTTVPPPHPTGLPAGVDDGRRCGGCAWRHDVRGRARCRQVEAAIDPTWPGCERFEPALDCQTCGACCREAYHAVRVGPRDPVRTAAPDYVVDRAALEDGPRPPAAERYQLARRPHPGPLPGQEVDRCAALTGGALVARGDGLTTTGYACAIYDVRPATCRDFTLGSAHCLTARRRVGLSLG